MVTEEETNLLQILLNATDKAVGPNSDPVHTDPVWHDKIAK